MRNFFRSIVEFFFPLKKELRLAQQKVFASKFEQYLNHLETRTPKTWTLNQDQKLLVVQIISQANDDDFGYFRFDINHKLDPFTAPVLDLFETLSGALDSQDREYQQDAWQWLYDNIPEFKERSDYLYEQEESQTQYD